MAQTAGGGRNSGGRGKYRQANKQLLENLREACPPHKLDDLEDLVRELKGDEAKIRQKISEWWEEPVKPVTEGEWEDVNKKGTIGKKKDFRQQPRTARGDGRGRGRGSREGRGRGRGDRNFPDTGPRARQEKIDSQNGRSHGNPPVESVRVPQGAWAKTSDNSSPPVDVVITPDPPGPALGIDVVSPAQPTPCPPKPTSSGLAGNVWTTKGSAHLIRAEKPTPPAPAAIPMSMPKIVPQTNTTVTPIARSMPKNPSPVLAPIQRSTPLSPPPESVPSLAVGSLIETEPDSPSLPPPPPEPKVVLETVPITNAWNSVSLPSEALSQAVEVPSSPASSKPIGSASISVPPSSVTMLPPQPSLHPPPVPEVVSPPSAIPVSKPQEPKLSAPTSFIIMGHWGADDIDDTNVDIEFGTFDTTVSSNEATISAVEVAKTPPSTIDMNQPSASTASPARPPPGLSMTGMPPMPANAVLVHELENKLEQVSLDTNNKQNNTGVEKPITGMQQHHMSQISHDMSGPHIHGIHSQNPYNTANQYAGAMGMAYNYGTGPAAAAVNAFVGMPGPGAPVLSTPQQPPVPKPPSSGPLQQAGTSGLYGTPHSSQSSSSIPGTTVTGSNSDTVPSANAGIPPGMPNPAIPYGNPPLYYGQQPPFHMGHGQAGLGFNYYGAQFGGVQGFGYPQGMGQSSGYGHAYHDDQGVTGTHSHTQQGSGGGYQPQPKNNSGGYRSGRNSHSHHNNNNQYQQTHQYNPQQHHQGGYGGQPYGMGYHGDHFSQRGAYGTMQDPYGMQPQQPQGGNSYGVAFQSDDQYKGKNKGNRGGLQHFQQTQGPPQPLSGQQGFGLQGQGVADSTQQVGSGGWPNQHSAGWSSGGTSSWQQK